MADWVWVESPGATMTQQPRMRTAKMGDGYEQRAPDGINNNPQLWEVPFEGVEDAIADEMVDFLRANYLGFNYVPLRATVALRVKCERWSRTHTGIGLSSLRCTFEQVFEP